MRQVQLNALCGTKASLTGYLHDPCGQRDRRPCVIVFPGGAYAYLSEREADPVAFAFFARGYQAFVLHYSVAGRDGAGAPLGLAPLCEASFAVDTIRRRADEWGVDPSGIAVCGFSAGGHLAASAGILHHHERLRRETGEINNRPDAMILCYPVITANAYAHRASANNLTGGDPEAERFFSLDEQVMPDASPAFIWHTMTDESVPVENSLLLAGALHRAGVPVECHFYGGGPHGLSLCNQEVGTPDAHNATWVPLCAGWLGRQFRFAE